MYLKPFQCTLFKLSPGWYERWGTSVPENGKSMCEIKHKRTGEYSVISYVDYLKVIDTFEDKNQHLL